MAAELTTTGRPIVAGEVDRTLIFDDLELDWAGAGYTLKLEVTKPDFSTPTEYSLAAVSGDVYAAKLVGIENVFPVRGVYTLRIYAYNGATRKLITEYAPYPVERGS